MVAVKISLDFSLQFHLAAPMLARSEKIFVLRVDTRRNGVSFLTEYVGSPQAWPMRLSLHPEFTENVERHRRGAFKSHCYEI